MARLRPITCTVTNISRSSYTVRFAADCDRNATVGRVDASADVAGDRELRESRLGDSERSSGGIDCVKGKKRPE